ncbi:hypothetical protein NQ317_002361 [Molorchus minor]|uniref:Uncharacterized protein n=1 Tax=Molorchus minor TaxID=1323400 RepID=A0ABQ9JVN5_9CUCU|nr:hypothetical protein NQ317_002361 [Molorchus minor]
MLTFDFRKSWDTFLVPPTNEMGSKIPIGWVLPDTSPDENWSNGSWDPRDDVVVLLFVVATLASKLYPSCTPNLRHLHLFVHSTYQPEQLKETDPLAIQQELCDDATPDLPLLTLLYVNTMKTTVN